MTTEERLAAYMERRAAYHEASGNTERAATCRAAAEAYRCAA